LRYWIIAFVVAHLSTSSSCSLVFVQLWEMAFGESLKALSCLFGEVSYLAN